MNKIASEVILILFLASSLSFVFDIHPVRAEPATIYIRADGSVEGTTYLQTADNVTYVFVANINDSIVVERNNIIIDGNRTTLQGRGTGRGIDLSGRINVTIRDAHIKDFYSGIWLNSSVNNTIFGNDVTNNSKGIELVSSSFNSISGNNATANDYHGIVLSVVSNYNSVRGNHAAANKYDGIVLSQSSYNVIFENDLGHNGEGIGLYFQTSNNNVSRNVAVANNGVGIYLGSSLSNIVSGNNLTNNFGGISLSSSSKNDISGNKATANNQFGISLYHSSNNSVSGNDVAANNNETGIGLGYSSYNSIFKNNITKNYYGISLSYSTPNNTLYHNNFINNSRQIFSLEDVANTWDGGYPFGGNYWSDYAGFDYYYGSNQNSTGSDGVGDTAYTINANNADHYPLIGPFKTFNAGTWNNVSYNVDIVSISNITHINFNPYAIPNPTLSFDAEGANGTTGFCRIAIPRGMMWCDNPDQWTIVVGGNLTTVETILEDSNYTYIYFTYTHSAKTVQIRSTHAVPEFQTFLILPLFITITLLMALPCKRKRTH